MEQHLLEKFDPFTLKRSLVTCREWVSDRARLLWYNHETQFRWYSNSHTII